MKKTIMFGVVLLFVLGVLTGCQKQSEKQVQEENGEYEGNEQDLDFLNEGSEGSNEGQSAEEGYDEGALEEETQVGSTGKTVEINVVASQFEFQPSEIRVKKGDKVKLNVRSIDVTHGLSIPAFDVNVVADKNGDSVEFVADKAGSFPFRCSVVCGSGHKSMAGTLIVEE